MVRSRRFPSHTKGINKEVNDVGSWLSGLFRFEWYEVVNTCVFKTEQTWEVELTCPVVEGQPDNRHRHGYFNPFCCLQRVHTVLLNSVWLHWTGGLSKSLYRDLVFFLLRRPSGRAVLTRPGKRLIREKKRLFRGCPKGLEVRGEREVKQRLSFGRRTGPLSLVQTKGRRCRIHVSCHGPCTIGPVIHRNHTCVLICFGWLSHVVLDQRFFRF